MNSNLSACGYRCGLCPVYIDNYNNVDKKKLQEGYLDYFNLNIPLEKINVCKGCLIDGDKNCLVRQCILEKKFENCTYCSDFKCDIVSEKMEAVEKSIKDITKLNEEEYRLFVLPYESKKHFKKFNT